MNKYKIIIADSFDEELDEIYFYILYFLKEPNIAKRIYNKIINRVLLLEQFPEGYPKLHYNIPNLRKLFVNNYIIIYRIDNQIKQVQIVHIFHSKLNYLNKV